MRHEGARGIWEEAFSRKVEEPTLPQVRTVTMNVAVPAMWTEEEVQELVNQFTRISRPKGAEIFSHSYAPVWGQEG